MMPIAPSARKHGVSDDKIGHALRNVIRIEDLEDGFMMFIGPDMAGNLIEVGVVDHGDQPVVVHAMPAREKYTR